MRPSMLAWLGGAVLLAACGAATSPTSAPGTAPASSGTAAPTTMAEPTVKVGTATVGGSTEQVLTDPSDGLTLYYFALDTPTTSRCTGTCAGYWPPLLLPSGQPSASGLSGSLSVVMDANGRQVSYNGHLLYRFSGDSAPGQANGQGKNLNGGIWYVATPGLSTGSAGTSPSPSSSGYGGGY
jgi:predicted lipoprotein with Yx(FWY)xxD motif